MPITIVIEDGTGVVGANSFASVVQARNYARDRGEELAPSGADGDEAVKVLLIKAMDYLRSLRFRGTPVYVPQTLPFPRNNIPHIDDETIPDELIEAQCRCALEVKRGVDLMPSIVAGSGAIIREKVGPIETQYAEKVGYYTTPKLPMVDALLRDFLATVPPLNVIRV